MSEVTKLYKIILVMPATNALLVVEDMADENSAAKQTELVYFFCLHIPLIQNLLVEIPVDKD